MLARHLAGAGAAVLRRYSLFFLVDACAGVE
jgi:hypothetical protein